MSRFYLILIPISFLLSCQTVSPPTVPTWVDQGFREEGEKVFFVGHATGASSLEDGVERARNDGAAQIAGSWKTRVTSSFEKKTDILQSSARTSFHREIQSQLQTTSQGVVSGMKEKKRHIKRKGGKVDVHILWSLSRPLYRRGLERASQELEITWYSDPERAQKTAEYHFKQKNYQKVIDEIEPVLPRISSSRGRQQAQYQLARAYGETGELEKGLSLCRHLIATSRHKVKEEAGKKGHRQTPQFGYWYGDGDFIFIRK